MLTAIRDIKKEIAQFTQTRVTSTRKAIAEIRKTIQNAASPTKAPRDSERKRDEIIEELQTKEIVQSIDPNGFLVVMMLNISEKGMKSSRMVAQSLGWGVIRHGHSAFSALISVKPALSALLNQRDEMQDCANAKTAPKRANTREFHLIPDRQIMSRRNRAYIEVSMARSKTALKLLRL
jgi:hypothetical protein